MNDEWIKYLMTVGSMKPKERALDRQQTLVDALRQSSMDGPEGQMIGKHYVAPSWTQYAAQLGQAYAAKKRQGELDQKYTEQNEQQRKLLEGLIGPKKDKLPVLPGATPIVPPAAGDDEDEVLYRLMRGQ